MNTIKRLEQFLKPYFPHIVIAFAAIFFGCGVGYMKVSTRPPEVDVADSWKLPKWAPPQPSISSQELVLLELWGEDGRVRSEMESESKDSSPWRLIGIVQDGETRIAIIEMAQSVALLRLSVGDELPNGAEITKIETGELTISDNGKELAIQLFTTEEG